MPTAPGAPLGHSGTKACRSLEWSMEVGEGGGTGIPVALVTAGAVCAAADKATAVTRTETRRIKAITPYRLHWCL